MSSRQVRCMDEIKTKIRALTDEIGRTSDKEKLAKLQLELARLKAKLHTEGSEEYYWSEER